MADGTLLDPRCKDIFRIKPEEGPSRRLRLHLHQLEAIRAAKSGDSYLLTTGTGSGKSLSYIVPIVDFVLRQGSGKGIRAIIVYPMNALANSQEEELKKYLERGLAGKSLVTFRRYTGQESNAARDEILANPPDILLTNYVMLELMLTRPREKKDIVRAARQALQFLVFDELHTYRGRQGADVAFLIRRVREIAENPALQCVGTSATLAGGGTFAEQQQEIAKVASRLFGVKVKPERVIGETLRRITVERVLSDSDFQRQLVGRIQSPTAKTPVDFTAFCNDPLASWIETTFGLEREAGGTRLRRTKPISVKEASERLAQRTGCTPEQCADAIKECLLVGYQIQHPETKFPLFAFRLHQFISRGDTVYASLDAAQERRITTRGQQFVPHDRSRVLLPLAFCRECGQEYYTVWWAENASSGEVTFQPRTLLDQTSEEEMESGFLYRNDENPWPSQPDKVAEQLPDDWVDVVEDKRQVKASVRKKLPQPVRVNHLGKVSGDGEIYHYLPAPFAFCLHCGVSYNNRGKSDYSKLAVLSSEGRSTATTILSIGAIQGVRQLHISDEARKLLSFTDNRQDASLQAGHFNDFVEVSILRSALYRAVQQVGAEGIRYDELARKLFAALNLPFAAYAVDPDVKFGQKQETERALREVLAYRIYADLKRGWRVTAPNLEQCGLLKIEYLSLDELCAAQEYWQKLHPALATATPATRAQVAQVLLDHLRRELAIKVEYLDGDSNDRIKQASYSRLRPPWAIDEQERMITSYIAFPRGRQREDSRDNVFVSARGRFGFYLRRPGIFPNWQQPLKVVDADKIILDLFHVLPEAGLLEQVYEVKDEDQRHGCQVPASAIIWKAGDGMHAYHDPIQVTNASVAGTPPNEFFVELYRNAATDLQKLEAREHTAQVGNEERENRETRFRRADLPVLYCSPTMELGVDIAQLNLVNMRNVPPTPANYAQRSGRAGRSGQPALVFTYCTTGSPHDQYFFNRPERMVAGSVTPPRLDLANEDLVRAHLFAVWLAEADLELGSSLTKVLDVGGSAPTLEILPSVREKLRNPRYRQRAEERMGRIFREMPNELAKADWYDETWLHRTLAQVESTFEAACVRWRNLYRAALRQFQVQSDIISDASRNPYDKDQARALRKQAEDQMSLLTNSEDYANSDFGSYRYFASEGFLPGYSFPRLPVSAYIPGRRLGKNQRDEYLNRPRFLAVSEFGPRSIIYHEGSKYTVNRVILPVNENQQASGLATNAAKICPSCGHLHPIIVGASDAERCEQCNTLLNLPLTSLLRMSNVSTRRRDRINSDEEERTRMGYELITGVRFEGTGTQREVRTATVTDPQGQPLLYLAYGHTATLWRINLGWKWRKNKGIYGFLLDTESGTWEKNILDEEDPDDPQSHTTQMVIPYAEDRRNALLIKPAMRLSDEQMASLQPALKNAIQLLYQLEDSELAAEPLPTRRQRNYILIYESAEGGAGVLRQLLDDRNSLAQVARRALELCHYDPDSGAELTVTTLNKQPCEAACYDCLMSYYNQIDHLLLDRATIKPLLLALTQSTVDASPVAVSRETHCEHLKHLCDSDLERTWLDRVDALKLRLPDEAQFFIAGCETRADFYYSDAKVAVYVDGPVHDHPEISAKDQAITACLTFEQGIQVVRFRYDDDWEAIFRENEYLFGKLTK